MVERLDAGLQEQVCSTFGPLHGLFLDKTFTEHVIDCRLHKRRRNRLAVPIPPAIVANEATIVLDIRAELPDGSFEMWETRIGVGKVVNAPVEISEATQSLLHLPVPQ